MPRVVVPLNVGKVRVAMGMGGKYMVWNGKHGKHEFSIACRNRNEAEALAAKINVKGRSTEIELQ
jgi:hypothetical protein